MDRLLDSKLAGYISGKARWVHFHIPTPLGLCLTKLAKASLRRKFARCSNLDNFIPLIFSRQQLIWKLLGISIRPSQRKTEFYELLKLLNNHKPKFIIEIGTYDGGTLFAFTKVASPEATLISIDLPTGYPKWKTSYYNSFATNHQKIYLLKANSHDEATLKEVIKLLDRHEADFLFIDGDHSYEGVKGDFDMYSTVTKKGGIIALHDIVPGILGVNKFWNGLKKKYDHMEIVESQDQPSCGIGILYS